VWLYLRFTRSYGDIEDLLAERGLDPDLVASGPGGVIGPTFIVIAEGEIDGSGFIRVIGNWETVSATKQVRFSMTSPTTTISRNGLISPATRSRRRIRGSRE
jgi:hypothetical protein